MIILSLAFAMVLAFNFALAIPVNKPLPPTIPKSNVDHYANQTAPLCTTLDDVITLKDGLIDGRFRWQNLNVQPDKAFDAQELQAINDAMYNLMQVLPCISFGIWPQDALPSGDYVYIIKGTSNGCNSVIGKQRGRQTMNLQSPGCMSIGTIMHEMIHALGFHHEQCRPDRDDYVNIHFENIQPGTEHNFQKLSSSQWSTFNTPYNTQSIMHYSSHAFSSNGQPTIIAKNGGNVGSTGALTNEDRQKLKNMYGC